MIEIKIDTKELNKFRTEFRQFRNNIEKSDLGIDKIAKRIQKSAKLRAPRWTGYLAENIRVHKKGTKTIEIVSEAPYASAQEYGFKPHVLSPFARTGTGSFFLHWQASKGLPIIPMTVKGYKPHIRPAISANRPYFGPLSLLEIRRLWRRSIT